MYQVGGAAGAGAGSGCRLYNTSHGFNLVYCNFTYLKAILWAKSTVGWTLISKSDGIFFPAPEAPSEGLLWPGVGNKPTPGGGLGRGAIPCFLRSSSSNSSSRAFSSSALMIWRKNHKNVKLKSRKQNNCLCFTLSSSSLVTSVKASWENLQLSPW